MRILILLLLVSSTAEAGTFYLSKGFGANQKQKDAEFLSISYESMLGTKLRFLSRDELTYYNNTGSGKGHILTRSYGIKYSLLGVEFSLSAGIGFNTKNTKRLASGLQFTEQVRIRHKLLWMGYSHYSNAGIKGPNLGLDAINFGIAVDF